MKKTVVTLLSAVALGVSAQAKNQTETENATAKGQVEVYAFDAFRLHVYYTNDALGDASFIIEGNDGLVVLETPLFLDNIAEFNAYMRQLKKPIVARIADYHVGGTEHHDIIMAEGMPSFTKGEIYSGMMKHFADTWGNSITGLPTGKMQEVPFGKTQEYAGVSFLFEHGATSDFPAASILIGGKVYYTHWTPVEAHISPLQVNSIAAIEAEIAEAEKSLQSGAELFIGGHGGAAERNAVEFKIAYLQTLKRLATECESVETFTTAVCNVYPNLNGKENLQGVAVALYQ